MCCTDGSGAHLLRSAPSAGPRPTTTATMKESDVPGKFRFHVNIELRESVLIRVIARP